MNYEISFLLCLGTIYFQMRECLDSFPNSSVPTPTNKELTMNVIWMTILDTSFVLHILKITADQELPNSRATAGKTWNRNHGSTDGNSIWKTSWSSWFWASVATRSRRSGKTESQIDRYKMDKPKSWETSKAYIKFRRLSEKVPFRLWGRNEASFGINDPDTLTKHFTAGSIFPKLGILPVINDDETEGKLFIA